MDRPDNEPDAQPRDRESIPQHEESLVEGGLAEAEAKTPAGHTAGADGSRAGRAASVARSAGIVSLAVMASRVLGLVREMVFAFFFGASRSFANDAFVIAFRIPNLLRDLFAEGALSSAFVPVFSDYLVNKDEKEAFRLSNLVATTLVLVLGALVVLGIVFAPQIIAVFAPGFREDPQKFDLTVRLTRIMMPFILLVALAAQAMGILNARDRFAIPALSSSFFNIGSLIGGFSFAVLLADPTLSDPVRAVLDRPTEAITGMAYGVLIGGLMQYGVQWPSLRRAGFRYRPILSFSDPGVRRIFVLMGPAVIGAAAVQVNVLVNSNFASTVVNPATGMIDNGPVSWLNYAFRLMQFPIGVFGVAIATATLPRVSRSVAVKDTDDFRHTIASSVRLTFLLTIPSAVGLAVLGHPIIALIYERGGFRPVDTSHTAAVLAYYAIGLAGYSAIKILAPAFFALGDARVPMTISLLSILTNFVMNWILVDILQERGLALSTSIVALLNFALLYFIMRRRIGGIEGRKTAVAVFKILLASAVMGAACWLSSNWLGDRAGEKFVARAANVFISVGLGAVVFYAGARLMKVEELSTAVDSIAARFIRRARRTGGASR
jgi:putative peptidoglycan lipid II flippase